MANEDGANQGVFDARVCWNRRLRGHFAKLQLAFTGAGGEAMAGFKAGQFVEIDLSTAAVPAEETIPEELRDVARREVLLRRPFSFADVHSENGRTTADLLYCVIGPGTLRMTTLKAGDTVSVIGPLGNGFRVPSGKETALLVGGGMGTPPLQCMARTLTEEYGRMNVVALAGARTADELPFEGRKMDEISNQLGFFVREFAQFGIESVVATDDGSAGAKGFVTDCLGSWLDENRPAAESLVIYACGPEAMLARTAEAARDRRIDCQVSMERRMGCGIGLCQSCAVECVVPGRQESIYKLCCKEGPVFDAKEVVFKV